MTSSSADRMRGAQRREHEAAEELVRRQGVRPVASIDDLARPGTFESDAELDEFLADLYASRRADPADMLSYLWTPVIDAHVA